MIDTDPITTAIALLEAELDGMVVERCSEPDCEVCAPVLEIAA